MERKRVRARARERAAWWCHSSDVICLHNGVAVKPSSASSSGSSICVANGFDWLGPAWFMRRLKRYLTEKINLNGKMCSSQDAAVQTGCETLDDEFESLSLCKGRLLSLSCQMTVSFSLITLSRCSTHSASLILPPTPNLPGTQSHFLGV